MAYPLYRRYCGEEGWYRINMLGFSSRRNIFIQGWGVLLSVPAIFLFAYFYPQIPFANRATFCAVRHFLGVDCPGCGLTRSFVALAHSDLRGSLDLHPMGVIIAVWLLYIFFRAVYAVMLGRWPRTILTQNVRDIILYAFLIGLIVQWIAKLII